MLMQEYHLDKIRKREKTETRRKISRFQKGPKKGYVVPPLKVGSIQPIVTKLFQKTIFQVKILGLRCERLGDISEISAKREGGYKPEEFIKGFIEMHGNVFDKNEVTWVYTIEYLKDTDTKPIEPVFRSEYDVDAYEHEEHIFGSVCSGVTYDEDDMIDDIEREMADYDY